MKMIKHYISVMKEFPSEGKIWTIAFRKCGEEKLYKGNGDGFIVVPNNFFYWRADPFLFEYKNETYVFVELFDRIKGKGKIGVAKIKNGRCGKFRTCLQLPYHLSYPCVFEWNDNIYMVPECAQSEKITVYKCIDFPYKWTEDKVIYCGAGVDTTPYISENGITFVSTLHNGKEKRNDNLYFLDAENEKVILIKENDYCSRPAGNFIKDEKVLMRPVQNCEKEYGANILINEIESLSSNGLSEKNLFNVYPPGHQKDNSNIVISVKNGNTRFEGIHTYNFTEKYEVIDLAYNIDRSIQYFLRKLYKHFKKKG